MSRLVEITKEGNNYTVNPNASGGTGITNIDSAITTFGVEDSVDPCYLAVDSDKNIITEVNELPNAFMILNVSSGGGNARSCYRIDDYSEWDTDSSNSLWYNDDCTFTLSGSEFTITPQGGYPETISNIMAKQTPLSYISVGNVGS